MSIKSDKSPVAALRNVGKKLGEFPQEVFYKGARFALSVVGREKIVYINETHALKIYRGYLGISQKEAYENFLNLKIANLLFPDFFLKHEEFLHSGEALIVRGYSKIDIRKAPGFLAERIQLPEAYLKEIHEHYTAYFLVQVRNLQHFPPLSLYSAALDKFSEFGIEACPLPHNVFYGREKNRLVFFEIREFNLGKFLKGLRRGLDKHQQRTFGNLSHHWQSKEEVIHLLENFRNQDNVTLEKIAEFKSAI